MVCDEGLTATRDCHISWPSAVTSDVAVGFEVSTGSLIPSFCSLRFVNRLGRDTLVAFGCLGIGVMLARVSIMLMSVVVGAC